MPQSSWTAIVARVKGQVETVANVGLVHDSLRIAVDENTHRSLFVTTVGGEQKVRAWMIHVEGPDAKFADSGGSQEWNRRVVIEGFLQIEAGNAGEHAAATLAEAIIRTLAADLRATKLNGTVLGGKPPTVQTSEPRLFGPFLCHYLRLSMPVFTVETP